MNQTPAIQDNSNSNDWPVFQRGAQIVKALGAGALIGYVSYWLTRLVVRIGMLGDVKSTDVNPISYILSGVISSAIVQTAQLTYEAALVALGDRNDYEKVSPSTNNTLLDKFRQHSWKVIKKAENLEQDIDILYSRLFRIRTEREVQAQKIQDIELENSEVFRRVFTQQVKESLFKTSVPNTIAMYVVESIGYSFVGRQMLLTGNILSFMVGLQMKFEAALRKIETEKEQIAENWAECEMLAIIAQSKPAIDNSISDKQLDDERLNKDNEDEIELDKIPSNRSFHLFECV